MPVRANAGVSRAARFASGWPAQLRIEGTAYACKAHDLSRTGVLLEGRLPEPATAAVEIVLVSPQGEVSLELSGRVVRVARQPAEDSVRLGIEFEGLDADKKDALEVLLARVIEAKVPAPLLSLEPGSPPPVVRKALAQIPVARRISLASQPKSREREFLVEDTHPNVLDALARNPNLLVHEACALAANRHLLPTTLETMANAQRWAREDELKLLIASHPHVSVPLGQKIVAGLAPLTLKKLLQRPGLNPILGRFILRQLSRGRQ